VTYTMLTIDSARPQDGSERLNGVGGWLVVLILSLTFAAPFWQLRIAVQAFEILLSPKHLTQGGILRLSIMVAVYIGLALFSCVSGIMLWSSNRHAPEVTKTYLIVSVLTVGILYSSYRLVGLHFNIPRILFNRGVYACVWYAYLVRSRRVRLTYAADDGFIPTPSPSSPGVASP
jgi:uncharacterized membrane protein